MDKATKKQRELEEKCIDIEIKLRKIAHNLVTDVFSTLSESSAYPACDYAKEIFTASIDEALRLIFINKN